MSVSLSVQLEPPALDPGLTFGDSIAGWTNCDAAARALGLVPLGDFHSLTPWQAEEFADDMGLDLATWREQWFSPAEGLKTVRGLLDYIREDPDRFCREARTAVPLWEGEGDERAYIDDLEIIEKILVDAEKRGVRFHFVAS
jgi:hypothetical protein